MNLWNILAPFSGHWEGTNHLWLSPEHPARQSVITAHVSPAAGGKIATITYEWSDKGKPHEGLFLMGSGAEQGQVSVAWVDSFHMSHQIMLCSGNHQAGSIEVLGHYGAPPGPDWGWRTIFTLMSPSSFQWEMLNIAPDGTEDQAVVSSFHRVASEPA